MANRTIAADAHWYVHALISPTPQRDFKMYPIDVYFDGSEEPTSSDITVPEDWFIVEFAVYPTALNPEYINDEMTERI